MLRAGVFTLATLSVVTCTMDSPSTGGAEQDVVTPPVPSNLHLILNAKNAVSIGAFTSVNGDVGSSGSNGSVLFDVSSSQGFGGSVLANTVTVNTSASVGHIFGNDITVNGAAAQQSLGFDPTAMPQIPPVTASSPGSTNVSTNENQSKQLCPGQYGSISLGINSTLNLNGGVYQVTKLTLGDGAQLAPSEPVVILVSGALTTGTGSVIQPSSQSLNPMSAANIRIEVGGAVTLGDSNQIRAHVLATGKLTTGKSLTLNGAAWAKAITIGPNSTLGTDGVFSAVAPSVPPPCNDNNSCTVDSCVGGGTAVAFCRNAPVDAGTSCSDGNTCNGLELCDGAGQCQPGTNLASGASCADGNVCNGDETCSGTGTCEPGTPPVVDDNNACTADSCDAINGVIHTPLPDGTSCNNSGTCSAGTCVGGITSGTFTYTATNTNSAQQNTTNFNISLVTGQTIQLGLCDLPGASGTGDTFLRLFDPSGALVTSDDDSQCGLLSFITFTASTTGTFQLDAGCFSNTSCGGTIGFQITGP